MKFRTIGRKVEKFYIDSLFDAAIGKLEFSVKIKKIFVTS
jgi:hypothetical protein